MMELSTWYRKTLKDGRQDWEEYCLKFDDVSWLLRGTYDKGRWETFGSVYEVAKRIAQLGREDPDGSAGFKNGFDYSSIDGKFANGHVYNSLPDNKVQITVPLSNGDFEILTNEVFKEMEK